MAAPIVGPPASRLAKDLTLAGGTAATTTIPRLVYGTAWKKERSADLVYAALKTGFRGIDTAAQPKHYDEQGVGAGVRRAIVEGVVQRKDLFIQTKFTSPSGQNHITPYDITAPLVDQVHQSVQSSLRNFSTAATTHGVGGQDSRDISTATAYLDSVVLHSPMDTLQDTVTVWKTLESYMPHQIRHLGISNTSQAIVEALYDSMATKPSVVQNRFYDGTYYETDLRAYCRAKGIVFQSFWTLTSNRNLVGSAPVRRVARGAGVEVPAAYYALVVGLGNVTVLDGTTSEVHMKQDLEGLEKVGVWAEDQGAKDWDAALTEFRGLVGDED